LGGVSLKDVGVSMSAEYQIPEERAAADAERLVAQLEEEDFFYFEG
jgi:uncharacterized protein YneR